MIHVTYMIQTKHVWRGVETLKEWAYHIGSTGAPLKKTLLRRKGKDYRDAPMAPGLLPSGKATASSRGAPPTHVISMRARWVGKTGTGTSECCISMVNELVDRSFFFSGGAWKRRIRREGMGKRVGRMVIFFSYVLRVRVCHFFNHHPDIQLLCPFRRYMWQLHRRGWNLGSSSHHSIEAFQIDIIITKSKLLTVVFFSKLTRSFQADRIFFRGGWLFYPSFLHFDLKCF